MVEVGIDLLERGDSNKFLKVGQDCVKAIKMEGAPGAIEELRHCTYVNSEIPNNLTCQQLFILGWILRRVGKLYNW